jgi:uncharacterized Rmd1/YagE family protein
MSDVAKRPSHVAKVRALYVGERIETAGLERTDVLSTVPLAFRSGNGFVALFRYGVAVFVDISPFEEDEVLRQLDGRIIKPVPRRDEETALIEVAPDKDDRNPTIGMISVKELSAEHMLLIADAIATTVILARDEKNVAAVFNQMEPRVSWRSTAARPAGAVRC